MNGPGPPRGSAEVIKEVAGAITAVAGFVVIPGSVAMLLRLNQADLPTDLGLVVTLPPKFLIALGLAYIVFPLAAFAGFAVITMWLPGEPGFASPGLEFRKAEWPLTALLVVFVVASAAAAALAFGLGYGTVDYVWGAGAGGILAAFVVAISIRFAQHRERARSGSEDERKRALSARGCLWRIVGVTVGAFLPLTVLFAGVRTPFPPATLCLEGDERVDGVLIGETDSNVYVGEPDVRATVLIEAGPVLSNVIQGLRTADFGAHPIADADQVTFQRTDVVIADLATVHPQDLERISKLRVPLLAFLPAGVSKEDAPERVDKAIETVQSVANHLVVGRAQIRDPTLLKDLIEKLITGADELRAAQQQIAETSGAPALPAPQSPPRRIVSVPTSSVSGQYRGAAGPCPIAHPAPKAPASASDSNAE